MWGKMNKIWRIIATGISFTLFGLGGLVLPIVVIPFIYLVPGKKIDRERRAKLAIHYTFRWFVEIMRALGVLTYCVEDREQFNRGSQLILANHPSLIDVVFLIAFIRRADCVVKSAITKNPFMRGTVCHIAGYIANDNPELVIEQAAASIKRGNSLVIFPEGTRTTPGEPLTMQRGAANIALRAGVPITPVVITCEPTTLTKNQPWYRVPSRRFHFTMRINSTIPIAEYNIETSPSVAARRLTAFLQNYFSQELMLHE